MSSEVDSLIQKEVTYSGDQISVQSLESSIERVRTSQNTNIEEMKVLNQRNVEIQESLTQEVAKLRKFSDYLKMGKLEGGFVANMKELLSFLPFMKPFTKRSIEELLRQQYEISTLRVKEASQFADKLKAAESDLFDEIDRLNERILESARNEDTAAEYVLELKTLREQLEARLESAEEGSTERREIQADLDKLKRKMSEHSTLLQLYHTSEERIGRLKTNTDRLRETIGNLASDITQYVTAASEKLDLVAGQIQAIGTAADASVVMLEMKKSLDSMTSSMNETTQFVSDTQAFFRANLDGLMNDLELYDGETQAVMQKNLEFSREVEEQRISEAVQVALARRAEKQNAS